MTSRLNARVCLFLNPSAFVCLFALIIFTVGIYWALKSNLSVCHCFFSVSVSVTACLPCCLPVCLSSCVCRSLSPVACLPVCLSSCVCLSLSPCVCLSVCLCVCLSVSVGPSVSLSLNDYVSASRCTYWGSSSIGAMA